MTLRFHHRGFCSLSACLQHADMSTALPSMVCVSEYERECVLYTRVCSQSHLAHDASRKWKVEFMNIDRLASLWVSRCRSVQLGSRDWCPVTLLSQWGEKGCQCYINLQQKSHKGGQRKKIYNFFFWLICCHFFVLSSKQSFWKIESVYLCLVEKSPR